MLNPRHLVCMAATTLLLTCAGGAVGLAAELSGTVMNASGQPAAGVPVKLLTSDFTTIRPVDLGRTTTDKAGRFTIEVPEMWFEFPETWRQELTLLARAADGEFGGVLVSRTLPLPTQDLSIHLETWSSRKVEVIDADQRPVSGLKVALAGLLLPVVAPPQHQHPAEYRQTAILPIDDSTPRAVTDDQGLVELLLPTIESVGALQAEVDEGVEVVWSVYGNNAAVAKDWSNRLEVPRVMPVPLHVDAGSDEELRDVRLTVTSMPRQSYGPTTTVRCEVRLDAVGNATVTSFPDAMLQLRANAPKFSDSRLNQQFVENTATLGKAGIKLRFQKGIVVTGRMVATDGRPAENTRLFAFSGFSQYQVSTDADGRFRFIAAPGSIYVSPAGRTPFRGMPFDPQSIVIVPETGDAFEMPDVKLIRLHTVSGAVRDSSGQPVAGASVLAIWSEPHPQASGATVNRQDLIATDADGTFSLARIDPDSPVRIAAWRGSEFTNSIQSIAAADHAQPLDLTISAESAIEARGQVVDAEGRGIPDVPVVVRRRLETPLTDAGAPNGEDLLEAPLTTDAEGRYATPRGLPPWGEFIAVARVARAQDAVSGWKAAPPQSPLMFPDIVASSRSEITGRVATTEGTPIGGADVVLLTSDGQSRARTDENGGFTIAGLSGRGPLLIASADGFLPDGAELAQGPESITLTLPREADLARLEQGAAVALRPAPQLSVDERRELAIRLTQSFPPKNQQMRAQVYSALARIAPEHVRGMLGDLPANQMDGVMVRRSLALTLAKDRPAEGLELLEQLPDALMKLMSMMNFESAAKLDHDERMQLLARIVQDARGLRSADHRIVSMGLIGERLLDLGERARGEALLREWQPSAEQLAPAAFSGYIRGAFAEELAQVDADAALTLIEPLTDASEFNRHVTNIAHELAAIDPERAGALLDRMRPPPAQQQPIASHRDMAALRVCYRMVRVDADRAIALGDSLESDVMRVYCRGLMAESLLKQEDGGAASRALAGRLVDDAWRMLSELGKTRDQADVAYLFPSTMAGLLLPLTAELHPEQLPGRVWQAIALQRPMQRSGPYQYAGQNGACELALLLAEVDAAAARRIAQWTPSPAGGEAAFAQYVQYSRSAPELIAVLAPEEIDAALDAVQDPPARERLALQLIAALSRSGEARQRAIRNDLALWFPDDEDIGPQD